MDSAVAVRVPVPKGVGVAVVPRTAAAVLRVLAPIVAVAELLAVGVSPSWELGAIAGHVQMLEVNELQVNGARDKAGIEDGLQGLRVVGEGRKAPERLACLRTKRWKRWCGKSGGSIGCFLSARGQAGSQ